MRSSPPFRICTTCDAPPHFQDCEGCYGFGVTEAAGRAVKAGEQDNPPAWRACPVCGSTPAGMPSGTKPWQIARVLACEGCGAKIEFSVTYSEVPRELTAFGGIGCPKCGTTYTLELEPAAADGEG